MYTLTIVYYLITSMRDLDSCLRDCLLMCEVYTVRITPRIKSSFKCIYNERVTSILSSLGEIH